MALKDYNKAFRYGKKEYESRLLAGQKPTLESLDEVLPDEALSTESLGLVQIPIDQIVGTRYSGRSSAFASNFIVRKKPARESPIFLESSGSL